MLTDESRTVKVEVVNDGKEGNPSISCRIEEILEEDGSRSIGVFSMEDILLEPLVPMLVKTGVLIEDTDCIKHKFESNIDLFLKDSIIYHPSIYTANGQDCIVLSWLGTDTSLNEFDIVNVEDSTYLVIPENTFLGKFVFYRNHPIAVDIVYNGDFVAAEQ